MLREEEAQTLHEEEGEMRSRDVEVRVPPEKAGPAKTSIAVRQLTSETEKGVEVQSEKVAEVRIEQDAGAQVEKQRGAQTGQEDGVLPEREGEVRRGREGAGPQVGERLAQSVSTRRTPEAKHG